MTDEKESSTEARDDRAGQAKPDPDEADSLESFLAEFAGEGHQYSISRLEPKTIQVRGQVKNIAGHLQTVYQSPTADDIKQWYGGGLYLIRVMGPKPGTNGAKFLTSRRVRIAGDPRLSNEPDASSPHPASGESPALVEKVLDATLEEKRRTDERLDRVMSAQPANDPAMWQSTISALERSTKEQIEVLRQQLDRRDRELAEVRQHRSALENPEVLKVLFGRSSDDGSRASESLRRDLQAERERYERELETVRERHERELHSERERYERDLALEKRDRENAVATLERLHRSEVEHLKTAHAQLVSSKGDQLARLNEEIRAARSAARPQDALSDLQRMGKIVAAAREFLPESGNESGEASSMWERLAEKAAPTLLDTLGKIATNVQAQAQAQPDPRRVVVPPPGFVRVPPGVRFEGPPAGWVRPPRPTNVAGSPPAGAQPQNVRNGASVANPPGAQPTSAQPSTPPAGAVPAAVTDGLGFLEGAMRNGIAPEQVARSARSLFGGGVAPLAAMPPQQMIAAAEQTAPNSILVTVAGRRFMTEFHAALVRELNGSADTTQP